MNLAEGFQFSQGVLQDAVDCKRRFQLRYLEERAWPALIADPVLDQERHMRQGVQFHRLVQQHQLAMPEDRLTALASEPDLQRWWANYAKHPPENLPPQRHPELILSASIENFRLMAKYDLIAIEPGQRAVIVDWKTSRKRPAQKWLSERMQTRVYRYLLVKAGAHLNGGTALLPEQVEMVYWFADFPNEPERFAYNDEQFEADDTLIGDLIRTMNTLDPDQFLMTDDEHHCRFCPYRSLCNRGVKAGDWQALEDEVDVDDVGIDLELEHIAEIEF
jgi:CRISPR/Cas system-associated exonuclease Cas4 (RecB family)